MTAVLHTWGQKLDQHVHVHLIVTGGGLDATRQQWVACKPPDFLFPVRAVSKGFRGKVLAGFRRLRQQAQLTCAELGQAGAWRMFLATRKGVQSGVTAALSGDAASVRSTICEGAEALAA
jgi:hypothetical protein